jgi:glycine/D-amino acid oxidase-like deaminating enzyme
MSTVRADVAIAGGGIIGCLIAREIAARAPDASVVLLERDTVGGGASRRSAGLHLPRGATERVRQMARYSQDYYAQLKEESPELPIHPLGMVLVGSAGSEPLLRETYLDSSKLTRVDGALGHGVRVPVGAEVWQGEGSHYADVYALTQTLARRLRPRVSVREGVRVSGVSPATDGVILRLSTGDTLAAGRLVLAPGPWLTAPAWREFVIPLRARVKKVVALHVDWPAATGDRTVVFHDEDAFLLPLVHRGHWLYSYTCQEWDVDPDAMTGDLSQRDIRTARETLHRYAPRLADRCVSGRAFCDAYSGTDEPRIQVLDSDARIIFAGAANGSGYRLAPAIAAQAADLLPFPRSQS